jgi:hypothetical protein
MPSPARHPQAESVKRANEQSVVGVMIEDVNVSMDEIDRMCDIEHLDFISLGPTDISATMGIPGDIRNPRVNEVVEKMGRRIMENGKATGTLILNQDDYLYWRDRGFQVMCTVAQSMFVTGASGLMNQMKDMETKVKNVAPRYSTTNAGASIQITVKGRTTSHGAEKTSQASRPTSTTSGTNVTGRKEGIKVTVATRKGVKPSTFTV